MKAVSETTPSLIKRICITKQTSAVTQNPGGSVRSHYENPEDPYERQGIFRGSYGSRKTSHNTTFSAAEQFRIQAERMKRKIAGYSNIRALACMAIVILHTFYSVAGLQSMTPALRTGAYMVRNAMFWAVPCFVMVTGALLLDPSREVTWRKILGRYLPRILSALLFFTLLFVLFDALTGDEPFSVRFLTDWLYKMATDTGWSHMWYLYLMVGIYLLLPFYRMITNQAKNGEIRLLLMIYFLFQSLIPLVEKLCGSSSGFYICVNTVYPLFLFAGYALSKGIIRMGLLPAACCSVIGLAGILVLTFLGVHQDTGVLSKVVGNYSFPGVILLSAGIFELIRSLSERWPAVLRKALSSIDRYSFGIYLIHMLYLKLAVVVLKLPIASFGGLFGVLLAAVVIFLVSYATVFLFDKLKKLILGGGGKKTVFAFFLLIGAAGAASRTQAREVDVHGAIGYSMVEMTVTDESGLFEFHLSEGDMFRIIREVNGMWYIEKGEYCGYVNPSYCMVDLADVLPKAQFEIANASASIFRSSGYALDGVTGYQLYTRGKVWHSKLQREEYLVPIMYDAAKKFASAQFLAEQEGLTLKIYDAYRPRSVTYQIRDALSRLCSSNSTVLAGVNYAANGSYWGQGWFLAQSSSSHNFGTAIDVTLVDLSTGQEMAMPSAMHELSTVAVKYSSPNGGNFAASMNSMAIKLDSIMAQSGLTPISSEWWHFQDNDTLAWAREIKPGGCNFQAGEKIDIAGIL